MSKLSPQRKFLKKFNFQLVNKEKLIVLNLKITGKLSFYHQKPKTNH